MRLGWPSIGRTLQGIDYSFGWASFRATLRGRGRRALRAGTIHRAVELVETLESRLLLSTLPLAATTQDYTLAASGAGNDNTPSIIVDPNNPNKIVSVYTEATPDGPRIAISYAVLLPNLPANQSLDPTDPVVVAAALAAGQPGGWQALGEVGQVADPRPGIGPLATASNATVGFDHNDNFYVLALEHSNDTYVVNGANAYIAGAVVLEKYSFAGLAPVAQTLSTDTPPLTSFGPAVTKELYVWDGADPALNPSIAVDGNAPTYTDPTTGATQTDALSGDVYVAWNTNNTPQAAGTNNPETLRLMGSSDGGNTFTAPELFNAGTDGNGSTNHLSAPRLVVSQGTADGRVQGGQLGIVWDNYATTPDSITFNSVNDGAAGAVFTHINPTIIADALQAVAIPNQPNQQPDTPVTTNSAIVVQNAVTANSNPNLATLPFADFANITDLQVTVAMASPRMDDLSIVLTPPAGSGFAPITLLLNQTDGFGAATAGVGIVSQNMGVAGTFGVQGEAVGTVFDQNAARNIADPSGQTPYIGHFQPEAGSLAEFIGATVTQGAGGILGTWRLSVTDHVYDAGAPDAVLDNWSLHFSSHLTTNGDVTVAATPIKGAVASPFPLQPVASPDRGIGPDASIVSDNTLGSFSPYQGRLYVTYVTQLPTGMAVGVATSDDGGAAWTVQLTNPGGASNTEMLPVAAVDQATGTFAVTWYDARNDAANARVARYLATSLDGGATWSPISYVNTPNSATDGINTNQVVAPEPVPDNQSSGNAGRDQAVGYGDSQGVALYDGNVYAVWAGNENLGDLRILTSTTTIAGGPRVVTGPILGIFGTQVIDSGDMGPVVAERSVGSLVDPVLIDGTQTIISPTGPITYDNTYAADGTRQLNGLVVSFDRPVAITSFTTAQFHMVFHGPTDVGVGTVIPATSVTPLDDTQGAGYGPAAVDAAGTFLATTFLIQFAPQSAVGTYSYTVGPSVQDLIRTIPTAVLPTPQGDGTGNKMDQNCNALTGENLSKTNGKPGLLDVFSAPKPLAGQSLQAPYDPNTQPLIIPGPHVIDTYVSGTPVVNLNNQSLDASGQSITITLASTVDPATFINTLRLQVTGPTGVIPIANPTAAIAAIPDGTAVTHTYRITLPAGTYIPTASAYQVSYIPGNMLTGQTLDASGTSITVLLPVGANAMDLQTASLIQITGPNGAVAGPFTVVADPAGTSLVNATRTVQINLPVGPTYAAGPYTINYIAGNPIVLDNQVLDATGQGITVTLNVPINPTVFTAASVLNILGPTGNLPAVSVVGLDALGNVTLNPTATFRINLPTLPLGQAYAGTPYTVYLAPALDPAVYGVNGDGFNIDNVVLNDSASGIVVVFDRDMTPTYFTGSNVLQLQGPAGPITGPISVMADPPGTAAALAQRTFLISFPQQQVSGSYTMTVVPIAPSPTISSQASPITDTHGNAVDENFNAGLDTLRGGSVTQATVSTYNNVTAATIQAPYVTVSTLSVPDSFTVTNTSVTVNLTYPNDPDLLVTLTGPDGTSVILANGQGVAGSANFTGTIFDDSGISANSIKTATAPFSGTYTTQTFTPSLSGSGLTAFDGKSAAGVWTLAIASRNPANAGRLLNWSLSLQKALSVRYADTTAAPIKAPTVTSAPITVPDSFLIEAVSVQLNITYPHDPDLTATLIGPNGEQVILFSDVGNNGSRANFVSTIFSDAAAVNITSGTAPFFSTFQPEQALSVFNGAQAKGTWTLQITSSANSVAGSLASWALTFQKAQPISGLGEPVADQIPVSLRIFTMASQDALSTVQFTPVGGASNSGTGNSGQSNGYNSGTVTSVTTDPSDPSGNTVYVAGASGGVWKTTNFLTNDPKGPIYIPLTDAGPTNGVDIGSIAVFGRNNDTRQTIIIAGTGDGNTNGIEDTNLTPGVGFLRSMDGGATWTLLDSSTNVDANGNELPINSPLRDHIFVGDVTFKVVTDPRLGPNGQIVIYAAMSGTNGGIWRSVDSGNHWTLTKAGQATDVIVDKTNFPDAVTLEPGNFNYIYGAFAADGIYFSNNQGTHWTQMLGGVGNPSVLDGDTAPSAIPLTSPGNPQPNGAQGRIVLAKPSFTGNPAVDTLYQGWLYAVVVTPETGTGGFLSGGTLNGLYVTKDFGHNWTKVNLGANDPFAAGQFVDVAGNPQAHGNYNLSLAVDAVNPNIVYFGGTSYSGNAGGFFLRIDITGLSDGHSLYVSTTRADGGQMDPQITDNMVVTTYGPVFPIPVLQGTNAVNIYGPQATPNTTMQFDAQGNPIGYIGLNGLDAYLGVAGHPYQFLNFATLGQDPVDPFGLDSIVTVTDITSFNNSAAGALVTDFGAMLAGSTNLHSISTSVDPITGKNRLIVGDDQGVFTGVDNADGTVGALWTQFQTSKGILEVGVNNADGGLSTGIDAAVVPSGSRNGNLQLSQFYYGASQPSLDAAIKGAAMFYGNSEFSGQPQSDPQILSNGDLNWTGSNGTVTIGAGTGVAVDQAQEPNLGTYSTGTGTAYHFNWPCCGGNLTGFFQVTPPGGTATARTFGLLQASNPGAIPDPQWPYSTGSNFAVNPINGSQIVVSSQNGNFFETSNEGEFWVQIGDPASGKLDGTYAPAFAWGAPDPGASLQAPESSFIYAGTTGGHIYVTFTGGGSTGNQWINLSTGLDGSAVREIVADPIRGTHDAYAVTYNGVYYMADSSVANATWVNITGNAFQLTYNVFGDPLLSQTKLQYLETIAVDWRSYIPNNSGNATGASHPTLYIGGQGGVFRSLDNGTSWTIFPSTSDGAQVSGGFLPNMHVTDLTLSLGEINPATGLPLANDATNVLLATTWGRGMFAIRVAATPIPAPSAPNLTPASDNGVSNTDHITSITTPTFTGTGLANATVQIFASGSTLPSGTLIGTGTADANGNYSITVTSPLAVGVYQITARQQDANGNFSPSSAAMSPQLVIINSTTYPLFGQGVVLNVQQDAFITALYHDILARVPQAWELAPWEQLLNSGQNRTTIAGLIANSDEALSDVIQADYQKLLGRAAQPAEIAGQLAYLRAGNTDEQLIAAIVGSPEYYAKVGATPAAFIAQMYQDLLGRAPTATESFRATSLLSAHLSMQSLALTLVTSQEYKTDVINADFQKFLGRSATTTEVTNYLSQRLTDEQLVATLTGSDEYYGNLVVNGKPIVLAYFTDTSPLTQDVGNYTATITWGNGQVLPGVVTVNPNGGYIVTGTDPVALTGTIKVTVVILNSLDGASLTVTSTLLVGDSNNLFLQQMYQNLLGRPLDPVGAAAFESLLARGATRTQIAQMILASDEYHADEVTALFQRYLHRAPDPYALSAFTIALRSNTIEQVTAIILTSTEYYNLAGATFDLYITSLYNDVLHRAPAAGDLAAFRNYVAAGANIQQVINVFLYSNEYRMNLVQSFYQGFLKRTASVGELEGWVNLLQGGATDEDVISGIIGSDEYFLLA